MGGGGERQLGLERDKMTTTKEERERINEVPSLFRKKPGGAKSKRQRQREKEKGPLKTDLHLFPPLPTNLLPL